MTITTDEQINYEELRDMSMRLEEMIKKLDERVLKIITQKDMQKSRSIDEEILSTKVEHLEWKLSNEAYRNKKEKEELQRKLRV